MITESIAIEGETLDLFGHKGWAEWDDSDDCLHLYWWLVNADSKTFVTIECLVPHDQESLEVNEKPTALHIQGAVAKLQWMKEQRFPNGFIPSGRGYETFDRIPEKTEWSEEASFWAEVIANTCFDNLLRGKLNHPRCLTSLARSFVYPQVNEWIFSDEIQSYLRSKAENMADFWCDRIGMPGASGNAIADALHTIDVLSQPGSSEAETQKFRQAMIGDIMKGFNDRHIPLYDTDYGVGRKLRNVLEQSGLIHLQSRLPWKTWRHFDFSDAPKFQLKSI